MNHSGRVVRMERHLISLDRVYAKLAKLHWLMISYLVEAQNVSCSFPGTS